MLTVLLIHSLPSVFGSPNAEALKLTDSEQLWLEQNAGKIVMWYEPDYHPIEFEEKGGEFSGLSADIVAMIEDRLQFRFKKQPCDDWPALLKAIETGECAFAPAAEKTEARESFAYFTSPYVSIPVVIIGTSSLGRNLRTNDLEGKRIAVIAGYAEESYLREQQPAGFFEIVTVDSVEEGLKEVAFGRVDAYIESLAVASHHISRSGITNLMVCGQTDHVSTLHIMVSRQYPLLASAMQKALESIWPEDLVATKDRWISLKQETGMSPELKHLVWVITIFTSLLILGLLGISLVLRMRYAQAMNLLENSENRFRTLFKKSPVPLIEFTVEGRLLQFNEMASRSLGYTLGDIETVDEWFETVVPDNESKAERKRAWEQAFKTARLANTIIGPWHADIKCKDGTIKSFATFTSIIADRALITFIDVTENKEIESQLEKRTRQFETLFEILPFSCVITDFEGKFLYVNQSFAGSVNLEKETIIGRNGKELGRELGHEAKRTIMDEIRKTGVCTPKEAMFEKDGNPSWILFSSQVTEWEERPAIISVTIDITKQKEAERSLREETENLRVTLSSIGDAVITTDTKGNITRMNPIAEKMTGWSLEEALNTPIDKVFRILNSKTRKPVKNPVFEVLESGQIVGLENHTVLYSRTGEEYHIDDSGAPIRTDDSRIIGAILVFRDVTHEYIAEERMRQTQKIEAIGTLAGGIAHDFNNILCGVMGFTEIAMDEIQEPGLLRDALGRIRDGHHRATNLVKQILSFTRSEEGEKTTIQIDSILKEVNALMSPSIPKSIEYRTHASDDCPAILGDPTQIYQVLVNLATNARQACQNDKGRIEINVERFEVTESIQRQRGFYKTGPHLRIRVTDSGSGMDETTVARVFEPYFTTKQHGEGTGLGLSIVHGIVTQHDGKIGIESQLGYGTTVEIFFPSHETDHLLTKPDSETEKTLERKPHSTRILIVDDEQDIVESMALFLQKCGYQIAGFDDPQQALDAIHEDPTSFDLLITDQSMPNIKGLDLIAQVRSLRPTLPVILISGYSETISENRLSQLHISRFVNKPVLPTQMRQILEEVLEDQ